MGVFVGPGLPNIVLLYRGNRQQFGAMRAALRLLDDVLLFTMPHMHTAIRRLRGSFRRRH